MFRCGFFNGVTHRIDQWMGELFIGKKISPSELKLMDFTELKYWHSWLKLELKKQKQIEQEIDKRES